MKRQRALNLMVSATIALSIGDCSVIAASSSGGGSTSSSSSSSLNSAAGGRRPISSRAKFSPSSTTKTATLGRDGLRSNNNGGRYNSSSSSSRRRAVDILNLDIDDDDSEQLPRGGYSPGDLGDDDDAKYPLRELEDFDYETGGGGGMMDNDDDFDMDGLLDLDDGDDEEFSLPSSDQGKEDDSDNEYGQGSEKGALYDAYNLLHSLAQVRFYFVVIVLSSSCTCEFCSFRNLLGSAHIHETSPFIIYLICISIGLSKAI